MGANKRYIGIIILLFAAFTVLFSFTDDYGISGLFSKEISYTMPQTIEAVAAEKNVKVLPAEDMGGFRQSYKNSSCIPMTRNEPQAAEWLVNHALTTGEDIRRCELRGFGSEINGVGDTSVYRTYYVETEDHIYSVNQQYGAEGEIPEDYMVKEINGSNVIFEKR